MPDVSDTTVVQVEDHVVQMAAFRVGGENYVVDIMRIREIINPVRITPVPDSTGVIEGVINLRGSIIPIIDLRKRLRLQGQSDVRLMKYIIASVASRVVGFVVDEVLDVVRVPLSALKPPPQLQEEKAPGLFLGVCQYRDRLMLLLNLKKLLTSVFFDLDTESDASV